MGMIELKGNTGIGKDGQERHEKAEPKWEFSRRNNELELGGEESILPLWQQGQAEHQS